MGELQHRGVKGGASGQGCPASQSRQDHPIRQQTAPSTPHSPAPCPALGTAAPGRNGGNGRNYRELPLKGTLEPGSEGWAGCGEAERVPSQTAYEEWGWVWSSRPPRVEKGWSSWVPVSALGLPTRSPPRGQTCSYVTALLRSRERLYVSQAPQSPVTSLRLTVMQPLFFGPGAHSLCLLHCK